MPKQKNMETDYKAAIEIVRDSGGKVVGRTRLQKIACLLEMVGLGSGFDFTYRHYGPYSEELATAIKFATLLDDLVETEKPNTWGGSYSIFRSEKPSGLSDGKGRAELAKLAATCDSIELELAVTAAFLAYNGEVTPEEAWQETKARKPEKSADGRIERAKKLYQEFSAIEVPEVLPSIN